MSLSNAVSPQCPCGHKRAAWGVRRCAFRRGNSWRKADASLALYSPLCPWQVSLHYIVLSMCDDMRRCTQRGLSESGAISRVSAASIPLIRQVQLSGLCLSVFVRTLSTGFNSWSPPPSFCRGFELPHQPASQQIDTRRGCASEPRFTLLLAASYHGVVTSGRQTLAATSSGRSR